LLALLPPAGILFRVPSTLSLHAGARMDLISLLTQLISGAVGGNAVGAINKAKTLGPLINTILGALGGLGGGQLASATLGGGTAAQVGTSAVVGALLPISLGMLKKRSA
jgi:uncharacterized membrane protein YeaQ/YmgE (transglycosylase-associated protein family)